MRRLRLGNRDADGGQLESSLPSVRTNSKLMLQQNKEEAQSKKSKDSLDPAELYKQWKSEPNPDNGAKLLQSLEPTMSKAVQTYAGSQSPVLMGKARSLLVDSLPRYDGRSSLNTFTYQQLKPLQRWAAKHRAPAKVPTTFAQQHNFLITKQNELENELGRGVSVGELADYSGIPLERIEKISKVPMAAVGERPANTDEGAYAEASDAAVERDNDLWLKTVYHGLNPTNQFIMEHSVGLYGSSKLSNSEIAKRLQMTPSAISQRKNKIQQMLE